MFSSPIWTLLTLSASAVVAFPQVHGSSHGHHRFHGAGHARSNGASVQNRNDDTYNGTASTTWITVTVYPVDATTFVSSQSALPTANASVHKGCRAHYNQTVTSTSLIYVTVTAAESSSVAPVLATNTTTPIETTVSPTTELSTTAEATTTTVPTTTILLTTTPEATSLTVDATYAASSSSAAAAQFYGQATTLATYVVSSATSAAAAAYSSVAAASSYSGSKKGLSYNHVDNLNLFGTSDSSWAYNWACAAGGTMPSGVEFIPMYWGKDAACDPEKLPGVTTVLSYNEPDNAGQSNLSPESAYSSHVSDIVGKWGGKARIGSPAFTNSKKPGEGLNWMRSFLQLCKPDPNGADACKLDFLAVHWYNSPSSMDDFQSHITNTISLAEQYNIPGVWITEFAASSGSTSEQIDFMKQAIQWLDSSAAAKVERYAYFMSDVGPDPYGMVTDGAMNALGQAYNGITS